MAEPRLEIDRLALQVTGLSAQEGQRLAQSIVMGLAHVRLPGQVRQIQALQIKVSAKPGESVDYLAEQVVTQLLQQLDGEL